MDASLLTSTAFWEDSRPYAEGSFGGDITQLSGLSGHVLFESSGTSGAPKWIALSKEALLASAHAVNQHFGVSPESCWALALPLHHVGGFGVAARAFAAGCRFEEFAGRWDPPVFCDWTGEIGATHVSLVPTQVHDLVARDLTAPETVRAVIVGGGRLDPVTGESARKLGWPVLASYGMTEAGSQIATQGLECLSGPYDNSEIPLLPIWDAETAGDGRLRISGKALFSGWLAIRDGRWVFTSRAPGWHETDDRVRLEHRCITPLGRMDLRVKVLGELVDLEMIERELLAAAGGMLTPVDFVVLAVSDERAEHTLVPVFDAAIDRSVIEHALSAYAANAPGFRKLRPPVALAEFPRSPLGKPRRKQCMERLLAFG